jgi:hypothetical protein
MPLFLTLSTEAVEADKAVSQLKLLLLFLNDRVMTTGAPNNVPHAIQSFLKCQNFPSHQGFIKCLSLPVLVNCLLGLTIAISFKDS